MLLGEHHDTAGVLPIEAVNEVGVVDLNQHGDDEQDVAENNDSHNQNIENNGSHDQSIERRMGSWLRVGVEVERKSETIGLL